MAAVELADRGTLFTFTTQAFLPKEPYTGPETEENFAGYALGYVELPGEVMVETRLTESDPTKLRIGMPVQLVVVPFRARCRRHRGHDVRLRTRLGGTRTRRVVVNVAIVGVGIHPFGRFEGVTGLDLGAHAVRQAVRDAGVEWPAVQFAVGGSLAGLLPGSDESVQADQLVNLLGLTGVPVHERAQRLRNSRQHDRHGRGVDRVGSIRPRRVCGLRSARSGSLQRDARSSAGLPHWYGDLGFMITTQFFAMKINRYMHDYGISHDTLAKVAAKNYRNGGLNPNAWRRKPFSEEEILESRMLNYPLTQYMFCSPDEGAAAVVLCRADLAHRYTDHPVYLRAVAMRTRKFGSFEVFAPWLAVERGHSPTVDAAAACFEQAGVAPNDVQVAQLQDSESGAEIMHMSETGLCADGEQEALIQSGATEIGGRLPVNTDGGLIANGEPIGASGMRQVHEIVLQLRGDAGERQVPGSPSVGFTQVYGAPGVSCCTLLTT